MKSFIVRDSILSKARKRLHSAGNALIAGGAAAGFAGVVNALGKNSFTSGSISGDGDGDGNGNGNGDGDDNACGESELSEFQSAINQALASPPTDDKDPLYIFLGGDSTQVGWGAKTGQFPYNTEQYPATDLSCSISFANIPLVQMFDKTMQDFEVVAVRDMQAKYDDMEEWHNSQQAGTALNYIYVSAEYDSSNGGTVSGFYSNCQSYGACGPADCIDFQTDYTPEQFVDLLINAC